jgi:DNA modification methylase
MTEAATATILTGDALETLRTLPSGSVHCCVTSPPYWGLRDYGCDGQIGLEDTHEQFTERLVAVFREVRRVLRDDGTCWVNMGDGYCTQGGPGVQGKHGECAGRAAAILAVREGRTGKRAEGIKPKDLIGQPWMLAFALRADGWYLRQDIIWHKPNPMPESVTDRCTKAHEYIFLLTKSARYFYDAEAIKEKSNGNAHARGSGVNPKAKMAKVGGWAGKDGGAPDGEHTAVARAQGPRSKQNESFSEAVKDLVDERNKRSVWTVTTRGYPEAHFATFPPKLIEPCIKAGCPGQCCSKCGAPWKREVDVSYDNPGSRTTNGPRSVENRHQTAGFKQRLEKRTKTLGFKPTCECAAEPAGGVVLDPFGGSGTTAEVALRNDRSAILIELNPEYVELIHKRLHPVLGGRLFA